MINILRIYTTNVCKYNGLDAYSVHAPYLLDEHTYLEGKHIFLCCILCPYGHYMLISFLLFHKQNKLSSNLSGQGIITHIAFKSKWWYYIMHLNSKYFKWIFFFEVDRLINWCCTKTESCIQESKGVIVYSFDLHQATNLDLKLID